ncbi:protein-glutamate O-methyltransferase CheR [soil metagenome]
MQIPGIKESIQDIQQIARHLYDSDLEGYHHDFLGRRFHLMAVRKGIKSGAELKDAFVNNEDFSREILNSLNVSVTELFRDPEFFRGLITILKAEWNPEDLKRIWHAGCADGSETFSLAILLSEENLLCHSLLYGTDINHLKLQQASLGKIALKDLIGYVHAYRKAGGKYSLRSHFNTAYHQGILKGKLMKHLHFGYHNLSVDPAFTNCNLAICRNLLIYYQFPYQEKILAALDKSILLNGILCLGPKETLSGFSIVGKYHCISPELKIYKKIKL